MTHKKSNLETGNYQIVKKKRVSRIVMPVVGGERGNGHNKYILRLALNECPNDCIIR
jgi:hypothetical protein